MVGPLKVLKMLHCRSIRSSASKKVYKKRDEDLNGERTSREENLNHRVKVEVLSDVDLCRVCLRDGSIPIYGDSTNEDISNALNTFAAIEVSIGDPYPKLLCKSCNALLQGAILFRKTAQHSDEILKKETKPEQKESESNPFSGMDTNFDDFEDDNETPYEFLEEKKTKGPSLMCKKCDVQFESFQEYTDHRLSADHENKRLLCPICKKSYASRYLKKHLAIHTDEVSHMCDICGKNFKLQSQFSRHRLTHFYHLPYKCSLCPYKGRFSESLKMHMRSHTGEKPYQCAQCPSRFVSKSNLNKHVLTHKGEHAFRCENSNCGKGFYTKRELEMHVKVDHTGVKEHVCRFCDKAFGYRKQMMKHERLVHKRAKLKSGRTPIYLKVENMKQQGKEITLEA